MLALMLATMTACERVVLDMDEDMDKEVSEESGSGQQEANALLEVRTRGTGGEAAVAYPLQVYVFSGEECKAAQTIGNEGQALNIPLVEGTYTVYAVGGASATDYALPTSSDATTTTAIPLFGGHTLTDLMAASATVTLVDGGTNTVTLGLQRKTMLVQDIIIRQVPTAATAVSVTIASLWQALTASGTFSGTSGSQTISLTRDGDTRIWYANADTHLLPPSAQPASISVNITIGGVTTTYTYSTSDQLEAGYKINIDGTYTEAVGVSLTGTITGATWLGERTISFTFDENGSSTSPSPDPSPTGEGSFPQVGDTYEGCYVLAATVEAGGESAELTLLSPNENEYTNLNGITLGVLESASSIYGTDGISGWRPMTYSEALLLQAAHTDLGIANDRCYLFDEGGTVGQMLMSSGLVSVPSATAAYVRPVATVTVSKE
jgi:hypothetical protein